MFTQEQRGELALYIQENYSDPILIDAGAGIIDVEKAGSGSSEEYTDRERFTLDQLMEEVGETFHEMLFLRIDMSGMTDVEVYKRANMDRKLFSKIRSNPAYHPRKHIVLALAIALRLSIEDTVDLLARAEYALSPGNKGDLIVRYFIERGVYDIRTINYALYEYDQTILGG